MLGGHDSQDLYVPGEAGAYGGALHPAKCRSKIRSQNFESSLILKPNTCDLLLLAAILRRSFHSKQSWSESAASHTTVPSGLVICRLWFCSSWGSILRMLHPGNSSAPLGLCSCKYCCDNGIMHNQWNSHHIVDIIVCYTTKHKYLTLK